MEARWLFEPGSGCKGLGMDLVFILVGKPTRLINRSDVAQPEGKGGWGKKKQG